MFQGIWPLIRSPWAAIPLGGLLGAAWWLPFPWFGPLWSMAFVVLAVSVENHWSRLGVAFLYYAVGNLGFLLVEPLEAGFADARSACLWWGLSAVLLSAGWWYADRPWKAAVVLLWNAVVPPMAFLNHCSPLSVAEVLFPGMGLLGDAFLLLALGIGWPEKPSASVVGDWLSILFLLSFLTHIQESLHPVGA